jgi:hypothetical protein
MVEREATRRGIARVQPAKRTLLLPIRNNNSLAIFDASVTLELLGQNRVDNFTYA